jgi:hypothetical protein
MPAICQHVIAARNAVHSKVLKGRYRIAQGNALGS